MFKKRLAAVLGAGVAALSFGASAQAAPCEGLACPNVLPAGSVPPTLLLPQLPDAVSRDLTKLSVGGYYAYNTAGAASQQSVAYVVTPGAWDTAPAAVKGLVDRLVPAERASKWLVIYGKGAMESGPWNDGFSATAAGATKGGAGKTRGGGKRKASAAALSDCFYPWFCVWTGTNGTGTKCQWQTVSVWQTMSGTSCWMNGESMRNTRTAWSLIKRSDGRNYCAKPNSPDSTLSNNGFSNLTTDTYNSTSGNKLAAWNCAN